MDLEIVENVIYLFIYLVQNNFIFLIGKLKNSAELLIPCRVGICAKSSCLFFAKPPTPYGFRKFWKFLNEKCIFI